MNTRALTSVQTQLPAHWSYSRSVRRMKTVVWKWKRITATMLHELWVAHEILSHQGLRTDIHANASKSWESYCHDIGLERTTAWRWLQRFDPAEGRLLEAKPRPQLAPEVRLLREASRLPPLRRRWLGLRMLLGR